MQQNSEIVFNMLTRFERAGQEETPSTPISLVSEMLDRLPSEVWSDPTKTFFDPACSTGTFLLEIVRRLNIGLKNKIQDQNERLRHILTKQVFGAEMNPAPYWVTLGMFNRLFTAEGIVDEINIFCANALEGIKEIKGMKFDVVVMNPPYQAPQNSDAKRGGGDLLWNKFVEKAINSWISDSGHLCAVHPSGWRKPESDRSKFKGLFKLMAHDHHMTYLEIHDSKDGMKTFNAGTRYDWYVIHKNQSGQTKIKDQNGEEEIYDLADYLWLPNHSFKSVSKLLGGGSGIIFDRTNYGSDKKWTSPERTEVFKYPLVHSTTKKGVRYYYSSRNDNGHYGIPKVIFGDSGIHDTIVDMDGEYGMTQHGMAIPVQSEEDAAKLSTYLKSESFKDILNACSWSNFQIDWRMFTYFKEGFWRDQI